MTRVHTNENVNELIASKLLVYLLFIDLCIHVGVFPAETFHAAFIRVKFRKIKLYCTYYDYFGVLIKLLLFTQFSQGPSVHCA